MPDSNELITTLCRPFSPGSYQVKWWEEIWWPIRRFYYDTRYFIMRQVPGFFHRGIHGWAKHDTWNLDSHFDDVIIGSLTYLRDNHMGHPSSLKNDDQWIQILNTIISGFEAHKRIQGMDYDSEIGPFPEVYSKESESAWQQHNEIIRSLEVRDQKTFEMGMKKFVKYYANFWD
jgi:hypothetical protein